MTDCLKTSVNEKINGDGSATITLELCAVTFRSMRHATPEVGKWIENAIQNKASHEGDRMYAQEIDKHIKAGTVKSDMTKSSLIINCAIPEKIVA